jgi:hypothetical protein
MSFRQLLNNKCIAIEYFFSQNERILNVPESLIDSSVSKSKKNVNYVHILSFLLELDLCSKKISVFDEIIFGNFDRFESDPNIYSQLLNLRNRLLKYSEYQFIKNVKTSFGICKLLNDIMIKNKNQSNFHYLVCKSEKYHKRSKKALT